jgi:hypothetical protein
MLLLELAAAFSAEFRFQYFNYNHKCRIACQHSDAKFLAVAKRNYESARPAAEEDLYLTMHDNKILTFNFKDLLSDKTDEKFKLCSEAAP